MTANHKKVAHCHWRIRDTAIGLTESLYETVMASDVVRARWKAQHPGASEKELVGAFVNKYWPKAIPAARATLATMLAGSYDEVLKAQIHDALILDNTLIRGRQNPATVMGKVGE